MTDKVFARYTAQNGEYFFGVPPRDITQEEFDALDPINQRDVLAGTIYEVVPASRGRKSSAQSTEGDSGGEAPETGSENK
jgi:hypothetical protein